MFPPTKETWATPKRYNQKAKWAHFTTEHEVFVAYLKRYLRQDRVLLRFLATFPEVAESAVMSPSLEAIREYSWGPALLEEFE
ncbi:hypothetical protein MMC30_004611 [Trapelia coarctata]|nr:hypothetical protein [Trapelia coarctata]